MFLLEELVGLLVWILANAVYVDAVRKGTGGFRRFAAFWFGFPLTWISKILVTEGSQPVLEPPPDDEEALFDDVRRARGLAPGGETAGESEEEEDT